MQDVVSLIVTTYAYISVLILVVGSILIVARWIFKRKGPTGTYLGYPQLFTYPGQTTRLRALRNILSRMLLFSSAKDDPFVRYTSLIFHWSLWLIIIVHFDLVFYPSMEAAGISQAFLETMGEYIGTALAILLIASGLMLLGRRLVNPYLRKISNASDYFSILLILAVGIAGLLVRLLMPLDFAYATAGPYVLSLVHLSPIAVPAAPVFIVHITLAFTLITYFPLSKLVHPFSFFTNPTLYSVAHKGDAR